MIGLTRGGQRFLKKYVDEYSDAQQAALAAKSAVESELVDLGVLIHLVTARAKSPDSLRAKLRKKRYKRPERQLTDCIGVRVITYYRDDVDRVATRLSERLEVNTTKSVDKRIDLGLRKFGYSSVHLIARLKRGGSLATTYLRDRWFEIQIRSILEHSWAEIEHELVYKAGV